MPGAATSLRLIRLAHTAVWAFFAGIIVAIPAVATGGHYRAAVVLIGIVLVEVLVLIANDWRCPMTDDRRDNFDIYLPQWLARHNKLIFGTLYVVGIILTAVLWART